MEIDEEKRELKLLEYRAKVMPDLMKTNPGQWALIGFILEEPAVLWTDTDFGRVFVKATTEFHIGAPFITYIPA